MYNKNDICGYGIDDFFQHVKTIHKRLAKNIPEYPDHDSLKITLLAILNIYIYIHHIYIHTCIHTYIHT